MEPAYDAILIGAGHNTLACALHLASKGWRVGLVEQAPTPGGAVKTGEYTVPGFRHDWAAMNLSLFAGSAFFKAYGAELTAKGLEFVPAAYPFASVFPDGSWLGVSADRALTTARIAALSPEDAATWNRLLDAFPGEAAHLFGLLGAPMKMRALAGIGFKALRAKGAGGRSRWGGSCCHLPANG
jgi:phytoene dehydrogenase-like protein